MVSFRKSKKIGPLRVTVSKSGISTSAGVKGARVSLGADGKVRRTVAIPGSGIYDTKVVGQVEGKPKAKEAAPKTKPASPAPVPDPVAATQDASEQSPAPAPKKEFLADWFANAPDWLASILSAPSDAPLASSYQRAYIVGKLKFKVDEKHLMEMRLDHAVAVMEHLGADPKALHKQRRDGFGGAETKARKAWWKAQGL